MRSTIFFIAMLVASLGARAQDLELQPESAALESVKPLLGTQKPIAKRIDFDYEINNGGTIAGDVTIEYQRTPEGYIVSSSLAKLEGGKGGGTTQAVTACGLIAVSKQRFTSVQSPLAVVPIGSVLLGLGLKTSTDVASSSRLVSLRVEAGNFCDPKLGETLGFVTGIEHKFRIGGKLIAGVRVETTTCKVAAAAVPLSSLVPSLSGEYIPVRCESIAQGGAKSAAEYAFLPAAGQYLLLRAFDGPATYSYRPKSIEFAQ